MSSTTSFEVKVYKDEDREEMVRRLSDMITSFLKGEDDKAYSVASKSMQFLFKPTCFNGEEIEYGGS